ncbi:MAG TPA: type IV toxin-antitoxin system AbiEi family antitoxin domain-containing protein [Bryobacteraceae bacterium]|nr:type IV toxin-antitoxin system AbiEi family antitoxin domain-containing protein [Bryobacteraceae bacterium]
MRVQNSGKLNRLQHHLPEGLLVDARWLQRRQYSSALRSKYVAHGWLDQVVRGVYRRPSANLSRPVANQRLRWQAVVISLQTLLERPATVGGRTALELQGFGHYLAAGGPREIHLYTKGTLPGWISKLRMDARFVFHNADKLFRQKSVVRSSFIQQPWGQWEWPLILSSPERALLEMLEEVPQRETFHQADVLMEGMRNLSPRRLRSLLLACRSVKVKRLFFWFAERHNHAWLKALDRAGIGLGSGKRMLVKGGKLDPKFQITVPGNLHAGG